MTKTKLFLSVITGSMTALVFGVSSHAFAATKTWTGAGSDTNFSTGANWGGAAPSAGDDLIFPINVTNKTAVNDMTAGTSFNSITFNNTASSFSGYTISGN